MHAAHGWAAGGQESIGRRGRYARSPERQVPRNNDIKIGDRVPDEVQLQNFPALIAEKVPQVKTYKFFVTQNKIVVVSPQDKVVADLIQ